MRQHRAVDAERQADAGQRRAAECLGQAVVAPAAADGGLRAERRRATNSNVVRV